jgi:hypothetical protein
MSMHDETTGAPTMPSQPPQMQTHPTYRAVELSDAQFPERAEFLESLSVMFHRTMDAAETFASFALTYSGNAHLAQSARMGSATLRKYASAAKSRAITHRFSGVR